MQIHFDMFLNYQSHDEHVTKLGQDFECQVKGKMCVNNNFICILLRITNAILWWIIEIEAKYDKKMKALREELELRRKTEIHEIEEVSWVLS